MDPVTETITPDASSAPVQSSSEELVSTVELPPTMDADTTPEGGAKPEATDDATPADGTKPEGEETPASGEETTPSGDDGRFDKHPRFVELNTRVKTAEEANQRLVGELAALKTMVTTKPPPTGAETTPETLPFKDTSKMTAEELLDWQSDDPVGFFDNQRQQNEYLVNQGIQNALSQNEEKQYENRVESTFKTYAEANPDFDKMWDTGELKRFMDDNPGHNPISAHQTLTAQARIDEAVDKAVADALVKATTEQKAKRKAAVLGEGPIAAPASGDLNDAELKDPKKYGGPTSVLANRLASRRAAR